jgi:hypothetical protein
MHPDLTAEPQDRGHWLALTIFALAMALLEAVIVVYLRQLYMRGGLNFPLPPLPPAMLRLEALREGATLVMLAAVAGLAARTSLGRLGAFLYLFGLWDLGYYAGLKWLLGWPSSLLSWDILFLLPVLWLGPVLAPMLCALTMIALAVALQRAFPQGGRWSAVPPWFWGVLGLGALLQLLAFLADAWTLARQVGAGSSLAHWMTDAAYRQALAGYRPGPFLWQLFLGGWGLQLLALARLWCASPGKLAVFKRRRRIG